MVSGCLAEEVIAWHVSGDCGAVHRAPVSAKAWGLRAWAEMGQGEWRLNWCFVAVCDELLCVIWVEQRAAQNLCDILDDKGPWEMKR